MGVSRAAHTQYAYVWKLPPPPPPPGGGGAGGSCTQVCGAVAAVRDCGSMFS